MYKFQVLHRGSLYILLRQSQKRFLPISDHPDYNLLLDRLGLSCPQSCGWVNISTILIELPSNKPPPSGCESLHASSWNVRPSSLACRQRGYKAMSESPSWPWFPNMAKRMRWLHLCEIHLNTMNSDARDVMSEPPFSFLTALHALTGQRWEFSNKIEE